ncbi:Pentatricopeptide repeat-containing protein [Acorus calamus]|uniref:Pentatricopeptide repeat-containing protein n=1 Tax=Acorus calamus TaxID=4465 RepID=A0AAV9EHQ6_ACOCL|nr:Pentatricopeptide repeat-containing protein [Acorus calamus]
MFRSISSFYRSTLSLPIGLRNLVSLADRSVEAFYEAITSNSTPEQPMEKALDSIDTPVTSDLVEGVLERLRGDEDVAFRFFTWASSRPGYAHRFETYNAMIDILSCTKPRAKRFAIACDMLDYMKRNPGSDSVPAEVIVPCLRAYAERHLARLSKPGPKWKARAKAKARPEVHAFNALLDGFCKCGLVAEAESLFLRVKTAVAPDAGTFNTLFFGWCRVRNPVRAMRVLEDMVRYGYEPDSFTYNAAIETFCASGMVSEAMRLFKTVVSPTAKTYVTMIVALARRDCLSECFGLLEDMKGVGCLPDVATYKELIEGMVAAGKVEAAYRVIDDMREKGYPIDVMTYNVFMEVLCELKEAGEAMRLFKTMVDVRCEPSVHTYALLMSMFFAMGDPDGAVEAWGVMERRGCERNVDAYCVIIEGLFDCGRSEEARSLLEEVVDAGMRLPYARFEGLLARLSEAGDLRGIDRLSEHMRRFHRRGLARRFAVSEDKKSRSLRGK